MKTKRFSLFILLSIIASVIIEGQLIRSHALPNETHAANEKNVFVLPDSKGGRARLALGQGDAIEPAPTLQPFWMNDTSAAYARALRDDKFIVVLFHGEQCPWCYRLEAELSRSPGLSALEECAVFLIADTDREPAAESLAQGLEISRFPTISLLFPDRSAVSEAGRVVGYTMEQDMLAYLRGMFLHAAKDPAAPEAFRKDPLQACPALEKVGVFSPTFS